MSYYFIASIRIDDPVTYAKYLDRIDDIFSKYNGSYLAVDESPVILEGKWEYTKAVLIRFETRDEFEKWYYSEDYQEILQFRMAASESDTILVKGFDKAD